MQEVQVDMNVGGAEITEIVMEVEDMTIVVSEEMAEIVYPTGVAVEAVEEQVLAMLGKKVIAQEVPHAGFLTLRKEAGIVAALVVATVVHAAITKTADVDTEILAGFHMKVVIVIGEETDIMVDGEMIMDETKGEVIITTQEAMVMEEHHVQKMDFGRMGCFTKEIPAVFLAHGPVLALSNVLDPDLTLEVEGHLFPKASVGHARGETKSQSSSKVQLSLKQIHQNRYHHQLQKR